MSERNWAGNHNYETSGVRRPSSADELASLVSQASHVRAVGSRHSFSHIVDAEVLVDLSELPGAATIAPDRSSVSVPAHWTYAQVASVLDEAGLALHNLASLAHVSIAGAVATGTHGSGDSNGNLATAVTAVEMMTATGEVLTLDAADDRFGGIVVSLGALGIVTRVTLRVEPAFDVMQQVVEAVAVSTFVDSFDEISAAGYSVSAFTRWTGDVEQIWVKQRVEIGGSLEGVFGRAVRAEADRHPIIGLDAVGCTPQLGRPGPWHERLPHFRSEVSPSVGNEIQSEFFVPRVEVAPAIDALQRVGPHLADVLLVSEVRTIAADGLWMSPHRECDSVGFHFTWRRDAAAVEQAVQVVEAALEPFAPRPHWGKVFTYDSFDANAHYRRFDDFVRLRQELDPEGKLLNPWTRQLLES